MKRKFTLDLQCGSIGVAADQRPAMTLAAKFGFESLTPVAGYLAELSDSQRAELLAELKEKELVWGAAGRRFRESETSAPTGAFARSRGPAARGSYCD